MSPVLSIILPVYNGEAFLEQAIQSVCAQTLIYRKIYDLKFEDDEVHKLEYCAKYKGEMVGTANLWYKGECAIIYSVSTKKEFQKQGICKKMMSNIIKDLRKLGIDTVCVQTEKGFYTEKIYQNMGFEEVMLRRSVWREGKKLLTRRKNRSILKL